MSLFNSDKEIIFHALKGWINYIETGKFAGMDKKTILMLAQNDKDMERVANKLPVIEREQQEFIYKLDDLAIKILNGGGVDEE